MKPATARSISWLSGLVLLAALSACTTPRIPVPMWQCESLVHTEQSDDGTWLLCIDPNHCLEAGSTVMFKNLTGDVWIGGYLNDDGSFDCLSLRGDTGDLIQFTVHDLSGETKATCFILTEGGPVEDPHCGDPPS